MSTKKDVINQFGQNALAYIHSPLHEKGADLQVLIDSIEKRGKEAVLDVATGGGHVANAIAPYVNQVTAFDLTPQMLKAAETFITQNGHTNVSFVKGDAEAMPFQAETFDVVTCRIAPHHFPNVDAFISEAYRVLKPNGQFLLDDNVAPENNTADHFYNQIEKLRDKSHHRAWKKSEWLSKIEAGGFTIDALFCFDKVFAFDSWCDRMSLTDIQKKELTALMVNTPSSLKETFHIHIKEDQVISFQGQAIVLKARKS
ncbi:SAM-dependent methyltransferase [Pullulanibacillus camelliae]|uniref:SAM-dependent methyltransferase n=1 Tax=Pullulanibacillus camelliae TaxID=1707096 RepID=A0A8J2YBN0_9BACL|nr:class I SAM-dependent methyltransferase [Pullulanibacillus camelliae]GGE33807.1 SAM-dependent methyltransferase [Pullulanibacillus camelliae]